ncbi:bifunctional alpha,alpha-trehalose-phosphate synthase (UDP-forming)/trehalose-phosphatase [Adhaeribacter arboris]|uniref:Alpha,alpha-trehalose-phosphate synthase n=1 Tax=Adhaeribacter arboris TaxID=2072846 RepID=A0A2T2YGU4_9BACT|nr:bifunctional alpha,alpha-trehalose-phosphate synthase (UDP-forming)/trehalose-phosphatase [Adhaeribacter arboris]PSR54729.1 bifunctional alpha,alpha-trehalose-phosphate synthase (UDP-forming)/trehalose-phosphatase [Adhaeribacter arboris]
MSRIIIVSNRLPLKAQKKEEGITLEPSEGGLATGLGSVYKQGDNLWVGWPGLVLEEEQDQEYVRGALLKENMQPVFLTETEVKEYYEGFSNETLWPTFHYFSQYAIYEQQLWEAYVAVNQKFCDEVLKFAQPEDTIWVHDYQLLLVPQLIREKLPGVSIGFFQHIPFPSFEIFRLLPWRREIIEGMLGADLIGFHTYDDMRHFLSSTNRLLGFANLHGLIDTGQRAVLIDAFPMGIDYEKYATLASEEETIRIAEKYRTAIGTPRIIISIDRLDYSKGIPNRLYAFEMFLKRYPEFKEKVSLVMIVVPSRDTVEKYKRLKEEIDELVGRINSSHRTISWNPIQYFYRSFPLPEISAFYRLADVGLVTPMRDGMNLVSKEYIASKYDQKGVLILSEMAGAAQELADAIQINPNNIGQMAEAIHEALILPEEEQITQMSAMQALIKTYDIHQWVKVFMDRLSYVKIKQQSYTTDPLTGEALDNLKQQYRKKTPRLIFLDYDGTLAPFTKDPRKAGPDQELLTILEQLTADNCNRVVIISGRDRQTLENWLGHLPVDLIAEHGVWLKRREVNWETILTLKNDWKREVRPIMEAYVNRTAGSFIEEKDYSLVWHYRRVPSGLGKLRSRDLIHHLGYIASNINLQVMEGNKIVEIKNLEVNKGLAATRWLEMYPSDFIMAIGDDRTDEDMFRLMPRGTFTIKVGSQRSVAQFHLGSVKDVRNLLQSLGSSKETFCPELTEDPSNPQTYS